jgi:transposase
MDESGFLLVPSITRTWSPMGQTPHLSVPGGNWTKISAISAISVSPRGKRLALFLKLHPNRNIRTDQVLQFLKLLLRHLRGPIVMLWDRNTIHRAARIGNFLRRHRRVHSHFFPGYAPELNPDEFVWANLKRAVANLRVPQNVRHLRHALSSPIRRLRHSQRLLWSCIHASELPWT